MFAGFVVGSGLEFKANDERAQPYLDNFVKSSKLDARMKKRASEYYLFGELIGIDRTNIGTGYGRISFADPACVGKIEYDPFDGDEPTHVVMKGKDMQDIRLPIVREDENGTAHFRIPEMYGDKRPDGFNTPLATMGRKVGRAFYLASNSIIGATRGTSDTLPFLDWCAATEDLAWDFAKNLKEKNKDIGVITVNGASITKLADYRNPEHKDHIPPPGETDVGWNYVNENIGYEYIEKYYGSTEFEKAIQIFKNFIEIGGGPPEHYFGQAHETTYASAQDASNPFLQQMRSGQQEFTGFWEDVCGHRLDQIAIFSDHLRDVDDLGVSVVAPEVSPEDEKYKAELGKMLTDTVVAWRASSLITDEQAIDFMHQIAIKVGLRVKAVENMVSPVAAKESWMKESLRRIALQTGGR